MGIGDVKKYPLVLQNAGEDTYELMSFGHHDFESFKAEMRDRYPTWPMGEPRHVWMVRAPRKGYSYVLHPCDKSHPRALPVTCSSEDYSSRTITLNDNDQ